ncbi:hypothetical protein [Gallionella capsiferriformans]|uniref:Uncharacterized protein n=1 Tax=Gallionella capsiferriformans (strain ES-2) TaxID=395494 RepID=D9SII0_GALCS|nr:hypothetical protein [Gallionella capsiferriformans]ADL56143.1 hypothetical protein Galf_2138 [Gallionella capsiferriformans ES-2]
MNEQNSAELRQKKFRDQMKSSGKRQRTFFLSDEAVEALKKRKIDTNAANLNQVLEDLLLSLSGQPAPKPTATVTNEMLLAKLKELSTKQDQYSFLFSQAFASDNTVAVRIDLIGRANAIATGVRPVSE